MLAVLAVGWDQDDLKGWQLLQFVKCDVSDDVMVVKLLTMDYMEMKTFEQWNDEVMNTGDDHGMTKRVSERLKDDMKPLEPEDQKEEDEWASYFWHMMKKRTNKFCSEQYMVHAWPAYMNRLVDDVMQTATWKMSEMIKNGEVLAWR